MRCCRFVIVFLSLLLAGELLHAQTMAVATKLRLVPHAIHIAGGQSFSLNLPAEFEINVAIQGLRRVRFLAAAPDGRIFATDMYDLSDNSNGTIYILDKFNPRTGRFRRAIPYLQNLRNPNNVAFYTDATGAQWMYVALTDKLERYRYHAGELAPQGSPEVLATYPDYGLSYKYGGWHLTRTVEFGKEKDEDKLYVAVGSSCNECEEKEEIRATVSVMDPDGGNQRIIAKGIRNAVALEEVDGSLYATNMGADHLGDNAPDDTMFILDSAANPIEAARNYGWPYCYFENGVVQVDPTFPEAKFDCSVVPAAYNTFKAHSAPLGLLHFGGDSATPSLRNSFLVALHGSSKQSLKRGYRVVRVTGQSAPEDFITGFMVNGVGRGNLVIHGRPCGLLRMGPDAFLLTDDLYGIVYYIHRRR
jgi:glucose/arabinose dehydrogenase